KGKLTGKQTRYLFDKGILKKKGKGKNAKVTYNKPKKKRIRKKRNLSNAIKSVKETNVAKELLGKSAQRKKSMKTGVNMVLQKHGKAKLEQALGFKFTKNIEINQKQLEKSRKALYKEYRYKSSEKAFTIKYETAIAKDKVLRKLKNL
ncbi:MAG: hypothetical protein ACPGXZ_06580, partial [Saprospiraceae bacterium]